jgi:stress-induced morphogen
MDMATVSGITDNDPALRAIRDALEAYKRQFPGSKGDAYRRNPGSIRVKIIDDRFAGMSKSRRHDEVWDFLGTRATEDNMAEVSSLVLLPTNELESSLANMEFEGARPTQA